MSTQPTSSGRGIGRSDRAPAGSGRISFGEFELDTELSELRRGGTPVEIGATALRLLLILVERRNDFVSKETLIDEVWPDVAVGDASLYTALREARRAVDDDGRRQCVIQTKKGRGYRFVASLQSIETGPALESEISRRLGAGGSALPPRALVARIQGRTGGDAMLIGALLSSLDQEGVKDLDAALRAEFVGLPRDVLRNAVGDLPPVPAEERAVVEAAAALGRDFTPAALASLGVAEAVVGPALHHAVELGWIEQVPAHPHRLRFCRAAAREHLYASIPAADREAYHRAAAASLAASGDEHDASSASDIAFHLLRSGTDAMRAIPWCVRAARAYADDANAEEAVVHYAAALSVSDAEPWEARHELWIGLGDARFLAGNHGAARAAHHEAIELARAHGDIERLAAAVLGYCGAVTNTEMALHSPQRVALIEEALSHAAKLASSTVAALKARLALRLRFSERRGEISELIADSLARARKEGTDPAHVVSIVHDAFWASWSPDNTEERLALATEMREAATAASDLVLGLVAGALQGAALLELGDRAAAEEAYGAGAEVPSARHAGLCWWSDTLGASLALMDGRFVRAEELATRALARGGALRARNAGTIFAAQLCWLRFDQGRLSELEPAVQELAAHSNLPVVRAVRALVFAHAGRRTEARAEFEALVDALSELPRDLLWLATLATLSETAAELDDARCAGALYDAMAPYANRCVVIGTRTLCRGSAALYLGLTARMLGRSADAIAHFEHAVGVNARLRVAPILARSQIELARTLVHGGGPKGIPRAREMLHEAFRIREQLGLASDDRALLKLRLQLGSDGRAPGPNT